MQTQGFVKKQGSATDQRQAHIFLTDTGNEAIKAIEKSIRKTEKDAMKGFDKKERKVFVKMLSRLEINLSAAELLRQTGSDDDHDDEDADEE